MLLQNSINEEILLNLGKIKRVFIYYNQPTNTLRCILHASKNTCECLWNYINRDLILKYIDNDTQFLDDRIDKTF